jgi:hypothetical protein
MPNRSENMHLDDCLKYTERGAYACSWCELIIPEKKTSRNTTELLDWQSFEVMGLFCSERCAENATDDLNYRSQFAFEGVSA